MSDPRTPLPWIATLLAATLAAVGAKAGDRVVPAPASGQVDVYDYVADGIYPVRTALGITTRIELDPAEEVLDFSTGFSDGWDLVRRGNVFYLRPRAPDADTNLQVRTQVHDYIFELRVVASDWTTLDQARRSGVQYKVAFRYPPDAGSKRADANADGDPAGPASSGAGTDGLSIALEKGRPYHFGYDIAARRAPAWLVPLNVHDDGRFTYLRLATQAGFPTGTFPAVFGRRRRDGDEFTVNTSVDGDVLVVHGVWPFLVVRHGRDVVGIRRNAP